MAKKPKQENPKFKKPEGFQDKDNPSLIEIEGALKLRVFEDFYCETDCAKWKNFKRRRDELNKILKVQLDSFGISDKIRELEKKDPELAKKVKEEQKLLRKMKEILEDDRWGIQDKHEKEVDEAIQKMALSIHYTPRTWKERIKGVFKKKAPKPVDAEIAFADLKSALINTSTEEMDTTKRVMDEMIAKLNAAGQYNKAKEITKYADAIIAERAIVAAGFKKYVTEEQMVKFITSTEKGVMINFLRYYDDLIPDDVIEMKKKADDLLVFDNFVVAFYADMTKYARERAVARSKKEQEAATAKRRDPILFGMVKGIRKLFYITDWTTDQDDLTLKILEKALGHKVNLSLLPKASEKAMSEYRQEPGIDDEERIRRAIQTSVYQQINDNRRMYSTPVASPMSTLANPFGSSNFDTTTYTFGRSGDSWT